MAQSISHIVRPHREAYSREKQIATCMISLRAVEHCPDDRKPVDLVLVIDKSGSMGCDGKMELTVETAELVAKELSQQDRLCIVTYDSNVYCPMPLTKMDKKGKAAATAAIAAIKPGSTTNLSGGLLRGVEELAGCTDLSDNCSILLLTDGQANNGIQDADELAQCLEGALSSMPKAPSVFTFGYGADHNEQMLRSISDCGSGVYYFMETGDTVASSFADCLGGLLSVVGQNVRVTVTATGVDASAATPVKLLGDAYKSTPVAGGFEIALGDIYSEEEKDVLIEVAIPEVVGDAGSGTEVVAGLSYFDVVNTRPIAKLTSTWPVARANSELPINMEVDTQRARVLAAQAIKNANAMVRRSNDLVGGRRLVEQTKAALMSSPCNQSPLCQKLMTELSACEDGLRDRQSYESHGRHGMEQMSQMYSKQRCNTSSADAFYKSSAKRKMTQKWEVDRAHRTKQASATTSISVPPVIAVGTKSAAAQRGHTGVMSSIANFFGCSSSSSVDVN